MAGFGDGSTALLMSPFDLIFRMQCLFDSSSRRLQEAGTPRRPTPNSHTGHRPMASYISFGLQLDFICFLIRRVGADPHGQAPPSVRLGGSAVFPPCSWRRGASGKELLPSAPLVSRSRAGLIGHAALCFFRLYTSAGTQSHLTREHKSCHIQTNDK